MKSKTKTGIGGRFWHRWSEAEAVAHLDEFSRTAESAVGFARRKGISTQRLMYWKKRLASAKGRETKPAFVAVTMPGPPSTSAEIEVRVAAVVVIAHEGCDVDHVARLVEALGRRTRAC
jgi:hypothetical protein